MKKISSKLMPLLAALTVILLPAVAMAAPPTGPVTASGLTSLHPPAGSNLPEVDCQTTLTGNITSSGAITISSASFAKGDAQCVAVQANNLSWTGSFNSGNTQLTISGVEVDVPLLGIMCGPASVQAPVTNGGTTVDFGTGGDTTSLGSCAIDGTLTIQPASSSSIVQ